MRRQAGLSVDEIRERLAPDIERLGFEKAVVFGSFARGTATRRSDIDLITVMRTEKRFFERYDELSDLGRLIKGEAERWLGTAYGDTLTVPTTPSRA